MIFPNIVSFTIKQSLRVLEFLLLNSNTLKRQNNSLILNNNIIKTW